MQNKLKDLAPKYDFKKVEEGKYDSWIQNIANLYGKIIFDNEPHTFYRQYEGNQLGSGVGQIGQLFASAKRTESNDGMKYRRQIEYFAEQNKNRLLDCHLYDEINRFVSSKSFFSRLNYFFTGKLYRQRKIETFAFKFAVLIGKY